MTRVVLAWLVLVACKAPSKAPPDAAPTPTPRPSRGVLPRLPHPAGVDDAARVATGRALFRAGCASCHAGMWNVAAYQAWFRDGHARSLEAATREEWDRHVKSTPPADAIAALTAYERSRVCDATAYDRFAAGERAALDDAQQRGLDVFFGKGACLTCHAPPSFSSATGREVYENLGSGDRAVRPPTLRDVTRRVADLAGTVAFMASGGGSGADRNPALTDRHLAPAERADLVAFLRALDCPGEAQ